MNDNLTALIQKFDNEKINGLTDIEQMQAFNALKYLEMYRIIGNTAEFMELKEKRIPKKPVKQPDKYSDLVQHYYCPSCGRYFGQRGVHNAILFNKERYCQGEGCGQAMDWREE